MDDAVLSVEVEGVKVTGASVYVDGVYSGPTDAGEYVILSLDGGTHEVVVEWGGHRNSTVFIVVDDRTYATSSDVHRGLSLAERQKAFAEGKVSVRLYEMSFCSLCAAVRRKVDPLVDRNRHCIVYEKLSYYKHSAELGGGSLPFLIVEGPRGTYRDNGLVKISTVKRMIESASGCVLK